MYMSHIDLDNVYYYWNQTKDQSFCCCFTLRNKKTDQEKLDLLIKSLQIFQFKLFKITDTQIEFNIKISDNFLFNQYFQLLFETIVMSKRCHQYILYAQYSFEYAVLLFNIESQNHQLVSITDIESLLKESKEIFIINRSYQQVCNVYLCYLKLYNTIDDYQQLKYYLQSLLFYIEENMLNVDKPFIQNLQTFINAKNDINIQTLFDKWLSKRRITK